MKLLPIRLCLSMVLLSSFLCTASENIAVPNPSSELRIYLPRNITVHNSPVKLGQISIIRGDNNLVARANKINLGQLFNAGQKMVFTREMIKSRLATLDINTRKVKFGGAEQIAVQLPSLVISAKLLVAAAERVMKNNPLLTKIHEYKITKTPRDLLVSALAREVTFVPRLVKNNSNQYAKVVVDVMSQNKKIDSVDVVYKLKYSNHKLVSRTDIPAGNALSAENTKIEIFVSNYPELAGWKPPYGQIARRNIRANATIRKGMAGPEKPKVIVKRNQGVLVKIEMPGLLISANGIALKDGKAGEYIKVKMQISADSQRVIIAKVKEDGTLEPVF